MKKLVIIILRVCSKKILKKYRPKVVGITGSVGKTSTKQAVAAVMRFHHTVRASSGNYNTEIGVPLTIIGAQSPGRSAIGWLRVFYRAYKLIVFTQPYPEVLVLEMGADRPGDIQHLVSFISLDVGVLTNVSETHLERFKTVENVLHEKQFIVSSLSGDARAVLNGDVEMVRALSEQLKVNYYTYGFNEGNDIRAQELAFAGIDEDFADSQSDWESKVWGNSFKVTFNGSTVPFFQPHTFGKPQAYSALAAIAVGLHFKMNLIDISDALRQYRPEKGRMNLIAGEKGTLIIDDTYNSSPAAAIAAIDVLDQIKVREQARKFAVLGDMLELGKESENLHAEIGRFLSHTSVDYLLCVGSEAKALCEGAVKNGMEKEFVKHYMSLSDLSNELETLMQQNDVILVKGSQGMRLEKVVKNIMANPLDAERLLVRQSEKWLSIDEKI